MLEAKILIIDDDSDILLTTRVVLRKHFSHIHTERDPEQIQKLLPLEDYDVILLDMNFKAGATSGKEGIVWLRKIMALNADHIVIMITAYGDINMAVEAMKEGAVDFVVKPWDNKKLVATVMAACRLSQSKKKLKKHQEREDRLKEDIDKPFSSIIGNSKVMKELLSTVDKVGRTEANILILGENGTGKEMIAREIHRKSSRSGQIFISIDLGSVPESLFESELFGHTKGAFTDARHDRPGRFEVASGGTLFLDEIGNLSLPLQAKLLSALETRKIYRIGSNKEIPIDIRLICATNMPLYDMVQGRQFRDDLLYRINTVEVQLPPLRDKSEDVPDLIRYFMNIYAKKYQKEKMTIHTEAFKKLSQYSWPGNIRELQHVVERALIMADGNQLRANDFLLSVEDNVQVSNKSLNIEKLEKSAIKKALLKHSGNLSNAAKELGLGRTTLYRKMKKYGI